MSFLTKIQAKYEINAGRDYAAANLFLSLIEKNSSMPFNINTIHWIQSVGLTLNKMMDKVQHNLS